MKFWNQNHYLKVLRITPADKNKMNQLFQGEHDYMYIPRTRSRLYPTGLCGACATAEVHGGTGEVSSGMGTLLSLSRIEGVFLSTHSNLILLGGTAIRIIAPHSFYIFPPQQH